MNAKRPGPTPIATPRTASPCSCVRVPYQLSVPAKSAAPCDTCDGESKEIRIQDGQLFVCNGCCCGQTQKGFPALPLDEFKRQWKARGIRRRFHLTISGRSRPMSPRQCRDDSVQRAIGLVSFHQQRRRCLSHIRLRGAYAHAAGLSRSACVACRPATFQRYLVDTGSRVNNPCQTPSKSAGGVP